MDMTTTPGQVSFAARTQTGSRYDFGTWTTDEARRFWRFERTEEALDNL